MLYSVHVIFLWDSIAKVLQGIISWIAVEMTGLHTGRARTDECLKHEMVNKPSFREDAHLLVPFRQSSILEDERFFSPGMPTIAPGAHQTGIAYFVVAVSVRN